MIIICDAFASFSLNIGEILHDTMVNENYRIKLLLIKYGQSHSLEITIGRGRDAHKEDKQEWSRGCP